MRFYLGGQNVNNKKGLFWAKLFEFEEFSIGPFFCSSIQPQHTVGGLHTNLNHEKSYYFIVCSALTWGCSTGDPCLVWQYGLWSFQPGDTKLERFLPKNQLTQRKLLNFEFWINGDLSKSAKIWLSKSIFCVKNHPNLSQFFFHW
jgi:hypothetical protein